MFWSRTRILFSLTVTLALLLSACTTATTNVVRASTLNVEITSPVEGGAVEIQDYKIQFTYGAGVPVEAGWFQLTVNGSSFPSVCKLNVSPPYCRPADVLQAGPYTVGLTLTLPDGSSASDQVTYHVVNLPPDPGEAGKATLLGIDSDNDGVRDDIQRWIELNYPNSAKKRMALRQYSKAMNDALANASDKRASINNAYKTGYAQECLFYIYRELEGTARPAYKINDQLLAEFLNTQDRSTAYLNYNSQLGGEIFSSTPLKFQNRSCEIAPSTLPD